MLIGTVCTVGATNSPGVGELIGLSMTGPLAKLDVANTPRPKAPAIAATTKRFVFIIWTYTSELSDFLRTGLIPL